MTDLRAYITITNATNIEVQFNAQTPPLMDATNIGTIPANGGIKTVYQGGLGYGCNLWISKPGDSTALGEYAYLVVADETNASVELTNNQYLGYNLKVISATKRS